jgi:hypothetical protein
VLRRLADRKVTIWNDHVQDIDVLAKRLKDTEAPVMDAAGAQTLGRLQNEIARVLNG